MRIIKLLALAGVMSLTAGCAATGNMVGKIADVVPWGGEGEAVAQAETTQAPAAGTRMANASELNEVDAQMMDAMASSGLVSGDMASADEATLEAPAPYAPAESEAHEHMGSKY